MTGSPIESSRFRRRSTVIGAKVRIQEGHHLVGELQDVSRLVVEQRMMAQVDRIEQLVVRQQPAGSAIEEMTDDIPGLGGQLIIRAHHASEVLGHDRGEFGFGGWLPEPQRKAASEERWRELAFTVARHDYQRELVAGNRAVVDRDTAGRAVSRHYLGHGDSLASQFDNFISSGLKYREQVVG